MKSILDLKKKDMEKLSVLYDEKYGITCMPDDRLCFIKYLKLVREMIERIPSSWKSSWFPVNNMLREQRCYVIKILKYADEYDKSPKSPEICNFLSDSGDRQYELPEIKKGEVVHE